MAGMNGNATGVGTAVVNGGNMACARACGNVGGVSTGSLTFGLAVRGTRLMFSLPFTGSSFTSTHGRCCHTRHEWRVFRVM